jgi:hypothetical protein
MNIGLHPVFSAQEILQNIFTERLGQLDNTPASYLLSLRRKMSAVNPSILTDVFRGVRRSFQYVPGYYSIYLFYAGVRFLEMPGYIKSG